MLLPQQTAPDSQLQDQLIYQWKKQWYPVAVAAFLDTSRPYKMQLLGKHIVLWRDRANTWHCFEDACPHRKVPFSEGRIESDGTLLCSYHAWRFNGEGNCVSMPQAKDDQTAAKHCANPKSCATVYPTQERQGIIWVWAESGPQAQQESALKTPRLMPESEEFPNQELEISWNFRDLPYGWDYFIENVIDPAHVPAAHHGIVGDRYRDTRYYDMIRLRNLSTEDGCSFEVQPLPPFIKRHVYDFQPPCQVKVWLTLQDNTQSIVGLYATPTRPGWCRHIQYQILVKNKPTQKFGINPELMRFIATFSKSSISNELGRAGAGLGFLGFNLPTWLQHILSPKFLHQDSVFLHYQEKILSQDSTQRWQDTVYMPNPQDKMVTVFRKWWQTRAGSRIPWAGNPELPPPEQDKRNLFDVWSNHTQHCQVCQTALKNINCATVLACVAAALCLGFGAILAAVGFSIAAYLLKKLSRLFYVFKFEHAHND